MNLAFGLFVVLALALLAWAARRAVTLCELEIRGGRVHVRRGGLAPRILADLGDVAARGRIAAAHVRVIRDAGHARLEVRGDVSEEHRQQLRNVIGSVPLAKLTSRRG